MLGQMAGFRDFDGLPTFGLLVIVVALLSGIYDKLPDREKPE